MTALTLTAATVLLVDDSRPVRTVLKTLLTGLGVIRIVEACDRDEALIAARACRPDIAILDYNLGSLSGIDLARIFRDPRTSPMPHLPLILLAPTGLAWLAAGAREAGVDAVLPKPVTARTLGDRIASLVERAAMRPLDLPRAPIAAKLA